MEFSARQSTITDVICSTAKKTKRKVYIAVPLLEGLDAYYCVQGQNTLKRLRGMTERCTDSTIKLRAVKITVRAHASAAFKVRQQ